VKTASRDAPDLADAYCGCLAKSLQSEFDATPIQAHSVEDYTRQFSSRLTAASPDAMTQAACVERVRPKPATPPTARATTPKSSPNVAKPRPAALDTIAPAVREALIPNHLLPPDDLRRPRINE
jgi:hypothetical protein